MGQYVYGFAEGSRDMADLLGSKGANLAEMTRLGLPVPPGFTVTTQACREFLVSGTEPPELGVQVARPRRNWSATPGGGWAGTGLGSARHAPATAR